MAKRSEQVTEQTQEFSLKLPAPFDLKPLYIVDMPNGFKVEVYQDDYVEQHWAGEVLVKNKTPGWRLVLRNRQGKLASVARLPSQHRHEYSRTEVHTNPLTTKHAIEVLANALSKKKTTQVTEEDFDE